MNLPCQNFTDSNVTKREIATKLFDLINQYPKFKKKLITKYSNLDTSFDD
jgi:hypothetical protein